MPRKRSEKQLANDAVIELFLYEFPPSVPWNKTVTASEYAKLKNVLLNQDYTYGEIEDAIRYAKLKGKRYRTISSIAYVIEESRVYWQHAREREAELNRRMAEVSHAPVDIPRDTGPNVPKWLGGSEFGEVE